jgi:hypothetical protein
MHVKPITAQEKFNFPRANAILARAQALLWVRDWGLSQMTEGETLGTRLMIVLQSSVSIMFESYPQKYIIFAESI